MKLDGPTLYTMLVSASNALNNNREAINNMNVFPVPDGDTGINMALTLDAVKQLEDSCGAVSDLSKKMASVVLRAARGNSGAIVSLFFRGMSKVFANLEEVDSEDVARAFRRGTDEAYKAVMNPTEGTILTVMRKCTEAAEEAVAQGKFKGDVRGMFEYIVDVGDEALAHTPDQLPILKEVNVVDAGGYGFMTALNGMLSALNKKPVPLINTTPATESSEADFGSFDTENITFPYCTECIVEKDEKFAGEGNAEDFHKFLGGIGDSLVFVEDESIIKVHVHTDHPGAVLEEAGKYGMLVTVKVENMRKQHSALVASEQEVKQAKESESVTAAEPTKKYGFVSVCMGEGIKATFLDLGADRTIFGGQTMNPSTQDIIDGVMSTPAEIVYVLPNNKNIYLVAMQAARLVKDRKIVVLPTRSVPQGISAMISFNPDAEEEENTAMMTEALGNVRSINVTHAVRDTVIEGEKIGSGQMLGLLDGSIACVADTNEECISKIISDMTDAGFVTVFYGEEVSEDEANEIVAMISEKLPDAEVMSVCGGQPIYSYIISVE